MTQAGGLNIGYFFEPKFEDISSSERKRNDCEFLFNLEKHCRIQSEPGNWLADMLVWIKCIILIIM